MKIKQRSPQWKKLTKECWGGNNGQSASERDRNMTTEHNRQLESENNASRCHLPLHSPTFSPSHIYPEDFGWQQQGPHHSPSLLQGNDYNYASSSVPMEGPVLHVIYPLSQGPHSGAINLVHTKMLWSWLQHSPHIEGNHKTHFANRDTWAWTKSENIPRETDSKQDSWRIKCESKRPRSVSGLTKTRGPLILIRHIYSWFCYFLTLLTFYQYWVQLFKVTCVIIQLQIKTVPQHYISNDQS